MTSTGSTLAAKYATSYARMSSPLSRSDLHSIVHPPVKAFGNHARTTTFFPAYSARLCVLPSEPGSENAGAGSPAASPFGSSAAKADPSARSPAAAKGSSRRMKKPSWGGNRTLMGRLLLSARRARIARLEVPMKVHEYQAKEILRAFGVATPRGRVADTPEEARLAARELGERVVVKAQIHAGG